MSLRKLETTFSSILSILNLSLASDGYFVPRCGYKFDARVAKAANMTEDNCQERCPCCYRKKIVIIDWNIGFLNDIFSMNFE